MIGDPPSNAGAFAPTVSRRAVVDDTEVIVGASGARGTVSDGDDADQRPQPEMFEARTVQV